MTKEELAKKRGLKVALETQTPAEKLVTVLEPPKPVVSVEKVTESAKQPVGRPKKRKSGDKKMSFWIEADLVDGIYERLKYGDTIGDFINKALRVYMGVE